MAKSYRLTKRDMKEYGEGLIFVAPFLILFSIFVVVPVIVSFFLSLTDYDMLQLPNFVGIDNYRNLMLDDDIFLIAIKNTAVFAIISGPGGLLLSFLMAWAINQMKMRNFFSMAFYAPSITSGIAMSTVWLYIFSPNRYGLINNALLDLGIIESPILWNQDANYVLVVVILIQLWMSLGNGFLVFLAGLQSVNPEYYEAAAIDGVGSKFQELWYVTLPQMKPQLLFNCVNAITASFGVFDIAVGFAGIPSPNYSAHTIVAHLYDYAFIRFEMGYATAVGFILFLVTFGLSRVIMKVLSS